MGKHDRFVQIIREGVRDTVRDTLRSVVQEATEQEPCAALRDEEIRKAILDLIRQELPGAFRGLGTKTRPGTRSGRS